MALPKEGIAKDGRKLHYSVGAVIVENGRYLLIDRRSPPFGFAGVAGHIDEGETSEEALKREIKEESGLDVFDKKMLFEEEIPWNWCSKGVGVHHWYLFGCDVAGTIKKNIEETKSIGWFTLEQIKELKLEPVWEYWFKKLHLI